MADRPEIERLFTTRFPDSRCGIEVRSAPGGKSSRTVGGYAAVYNVRSRPELGIREVVEPTFFNKSQADGWPGVVARFEHQPTMLLGTTAAGTLRVKTDNIGLDYSVDIPESRSDTYESIQRRDITGSSFAFQAYEDPWEYDGSYPIRHLVSGRLIDVAPTATPAYREATIALRSLAVDRNADPEDVKALAARGELRKLWVRTDIGPPVPVSVVETRGETMTSTEEGLRDLEQKRLELYQRRLDWSAPEPTLDDRMRQLELWRHKMTIDADEHRSLEERKAALGLGPYAPSSPTPRVDPNAAAIVRARTMERARQ